MVGAVSGRQSPVSGEPKTYGDYLAIVTHPAFRLGFLDAQLGRDFDHERILDRIKRETPPRALGRLGWSAAPGEAPAGLFTAAETASTRAGVIELAQYRYEEGRLLVTQERLRCRAWGHPDYPPRQVDDFIWSLALAKQAAPEAGR